MGAGGDAQPVLRSVANLPSALDRIPLISRDVRTRCQTLVFFLDYDGTLAPIVNNPDEARLPIETRRALETLSQRFTTAIVSGRALAKVKAFVGIDSLIYAGSHGFDIEGPEGSLAHQVAEEHLPTIRRATGQLHEFVRNIPGASIEDNKMAVTVHYRSAPPEDVPRMREYVENVVRACGLRLTDGKMVFEVRPNFDWHKGKAVDYLLDQLQLTGPHVLPVYIGDDITDEDAFEALSKRGGIAVIVAEDNAQRDTRAALRLSDPHEVRDFLLHFAAPKNAVTNIHRHLQVTDEQREISAISTAEDTVIAKANVTANAIANSMDDADDATSASLNTIAQDDNVLQTM